MTERFIREAVLPDPIRPRLRCGWAPDTTQHALPMGSPGHLSVRRRRTAMPPVRDAVATLAGRDGFSC
jgi:hypothetical protein